MMLIFFLSAKPETVVSPFPSVPPSSSFEGPNGYNMVSIK